MKKVFFSLLSYFLFCLPSCLSIGAGMSDWRYDLPNNCTLWRNSSNSIMISYYNELSGKRINGIPNIMRLLQNFSFATATAKKCSFAARRAKNCKSLCIEPKVRSNRLLQQALIIEFFYDDRYVLAKTILPNNFEKYIQHQPVEIYYYVFDTLQRETKGPLNENGFFDDIAGITLDGDIIWISTSERPVGAYQNKNEKRRRDRHQD